MSGSTSNLGLYLPSSSDLVDVDLAINNNFKAIDARISFAEVTVKEDIASPYEGLKVLEKSGDTYVYITGQGWVLLGVLTLPGAKGRRGFAAITSDGPSTNSTEVMSNIKVTFVVESGRRYWIESYGNLSSAYDGSTIQLGNALNFRWAEGSDVAVTDTLINPRPYTQEQQRRNTGTQPTKLLPYHMLGEFSSTIDATITVGVSYRVVFGGSTVLSKGSGTDPNIILARDVGLTVGT